MTKVLMRGVSLSGEEVGQFRAIYNKRNGIMLVNDSFMMDDILGDIVHRLEEGGVIVNCLRMVVIVNT